MQTFEYKMKNIAIVNDSDFSALESGLNEMGVQGWEAILIREPRAIIGPDNRHLISVPVMFKRVKNEPVHNAGYISSSEVVYGTPHEDPPPVKRGPGRPRKYPATEPHQENTSAEIEPANLSKVEV